MKLCVQMVLFLFFLANFATSDATTSNNPLDKKPKEDGQSVSDHQQLSDSDDLDEKAKKDEGVNEDLKDGEEEESLNQKKDSNKPPKAGEVPLLTSGNTAKTSKEIGAGIPPETPKRSEITTDDKLLDKPIESPNENKIIDKKSIENESPQSITVKGELSGKPLSGENEVQGVNQEVNEKHGGDEKETSEQKDANDDNNETEETKPEPGTVNDDTKINKPGMLKRVVSKLPTFKKSTKASENDKSKPTTDKELTEEEQNPKITSPSGDIQETTKQSKGSQKETSDEHDKDSGEIKAEPTSDPKTGGIFGKLTRKLSKKSSSSNTENVITDKDSVDIDTENDKPNNPTENEKKPGMVGKLLQNRPKLLGPNIVGLFSKTKKEPTQE